MSRLILGQELTYMKEGELFALFNAVSIQLIRSKPGTWQRRNTFGSLENIQRAFKRRRSYGWHNTVPL